MTGGVGLRAYGDAFALSRRDRALLLAHYPMFRLAHEADYGSGRLRRLAQQLLSLVPWTFTHTAHGAGGSVRVRLRLRPSDLASFREIFVGGAYQTQYIRDGIRTYVDLGANTGMAACFFATQYSIDRMLLVEANPALVDVLDPVVRGLRGAELENVAVAGRSGSIWFHVDVNHRQSGIGVTSGSGRQVRVPAKTLREILDDRGLPSVDLLKVDIENAEHEVVRADPEVLKRVGTILMEMHGSSAEREETARVIESCGFSVSRVRGEEVDTLVAWRADGEVSNDR